MSYVRLGVNIDHVAPIRNAMGGILSRYIIRLVLQPTSARPADLEPEGGV